MDKDHKKYIFIDSNIYYGLFSGSDVFSEHIIVLLTKLVENNKICLLLPQQVSDEVSRNCVGDWFKEEQDRIDNKIQEKEKKLDLIKKNFDGVAYLKDTHLSTLKSQISREKNRLLKERESIIKRFASKKSKSNKNLQKVFKLATLIEENDVVLKNAFFRREKGNPPSDGKKFGDKLIWESLLYFLASKKQKNIELFFVTQDNTAWQGFGSEFNPWLDAEFKKKVGGNIILITDLSNLPSLTTEEQEEIRKEEFKNLAPNKLLHANTFAGADRVMQVIINNLKLVDAELVDKLLFASLENTKHSLGPYNQVLEASHARIFLQKLLQHAIAQAYDLEPWVHFYNDLNDQQKERFSHIRRTLKQEGVKGLVNPNEKEFLDPEDLPF